MYTRLVYTYMYVRMAMHAHADACTACIVHTEEIFRLANEFLSGNERIWKLPEVELHQTGHRVGILSR